MVAPLVTVRDALRGGVGSLKERRIHAPELTAQLLLGDVLRRGREWLHAHSDRVLRPEEWDAYRQLIARRCEGMPTQYLRGVQEFYGLEFRVTPSVLIPRPETEHLVQAAVERIRPGDRALDIGTGSGAVAVAVAKNVAGAQIYASDLFGEALRIARENARRLGADVRFFVADLDRGVLPQAVDALLCNPPYVPLREIGGLQRELRYEPSPSLFGGEDGCAVYRRLVPGAARIVKPGGWLIMELGYNSRDAVEQLLRAAAWRPPEFHRDLAGIDRVVSVRRSFRQP